MLRSKQNILNRIPQTQKPASNEFDFCRESSTNSPFSCKTNPNWKNAQIHLNAVSTTGYEKTRPSPTRKTNPKRTQANPNKANPTPIFRPLSHPKPKRNPNKPKQSQSDPHFSPVIAPQSQNKPKQTQSKPNFAKNPENRPNFFYGKGLRQKCQILPHQNKPNLSRRSSMRSRIKPCSQSRQMLVMVLTHNLTRAQTAGYGSLRGRQARPEGFCYIST